ncbi:hypothetical protein EV702DRAFT_1205164 [Suillus placidus]|uniref:Uncharacterized protein n=1 Tax=Suillus placidus TaxID=48579 RepID=A0A9P6ZFP9_9AGAM|nr:hypothetical protein EV702DRAFT_1205164 [Suillus placidus]
MDGMHGPAYMPSPHSSSAPHFGGNPYEVPAFLQTVDQLGQYHGLSEKAIIKYTLRYTNSDDKELFQGLHTCKGDSFVDFANKILSMYPQHRIFLQYTLPSPTLSASDPTPQHPETEELEVCQPAPHQEIPDDTPSTTVLVANELATTPQVIVSNTPTISDEPAISDPTPADPQSVEDMITMVIDMNVLTPVTPSLDPKPLADAIPEAPASDFGPSDASDYADLWDIDIGVFDYEPEASLHHQDTSDEFLFVSTVILVLTGYISWSRFSTHPMHPKIVQAPDDSNTKLGRQHPHLQHPPHQYPHLRSPTNPTHPHFRNPTHPPHQSPLKYPACGLYQYTRPSHSWMALAQYQRGKRALIRKKL